MDSLYHDNFLLYNCSLGMIFQYGLPSLDYKVIRKIILFWEDWGLIEILKKFTKVVSIEVFSYNALATSLEFLEKCWKKVSC